MSWNLHGDSSLLECAVNIEIEKRRETPDLFGIGRASRRRPLARRWLRARHGQEFVVKHGGTEIRMPESSPVTVAAENSRSRLPSRPARRDARGDRPRAVRRGLEGSLLAGILGGYVTGLLSGILISVPAMFHHELLTMPLLAAIGVLGGLLRDCAPDTEEIWRFSPFLDLNIYAHSSKRTIAVEDSSSFSWE